METNTAAVVDQSPSIAALAAALAKAQGAIRNAKKDSANPFFKSTYADLASAWDAAREPLAANGLAVAQRVTNSANGVIITTQLLHASGEWISDRCEWPVAQKTPQGMGSAITYGRRYAFMALVGIAAEEDDGNAASNGNERSQSTQAPARQMEAAPDPSVIEQAMHAIAAAETTKDLAELVPKMPKVDSVRAAYNARAKELRTGVTQ